MRQGEDKHKAFKRLASNRANLAINYIRLLGNLSNTNNYEFKENEVKLIFNAIENELKNSKSRFNMIMNRERKIRL